MFEFGLQLRSLTAVSPSHSYETVASMLGPTASTPAEDIPKFLSSSVDPEDIVIPSVSSVAPQDDAALAQTIAPVDESHFEYSVHTKYVTEVPQSAEPYMFNLADERSSSPSPTDSENGFVGVAGPNIMRKWPPLTEADITEISKDELRGAQEERSSIDSWQLEERTSPEKDSVQTSGSAEVLFAGEQAETGQDEIRTVITSMFLDKG